MFARMVPGLVLTCLIALGGVGRVADGRETDMRASRRPESAARAKVLNNFVTELLNVRPRSSKTPTEYLFTNPREGRVFISSTAEASGSSALSISIDRRGSGGPVVVHGAGKPETLEAMRYLRAGQHRLKVSREGDAKLERLVVRAVPEIIYCKFQYDPHVSEYGPYDWQFLSKYVLPNINTIVGGGDEKHRLFVEEWKKQGKRWIVECGVPGSSREATVTADEAYKYWSENAGFREPLLDGVIADEFGGAPPQKYQAWIEAIRRIRDNREFRGKVFYPYLFFNPQEGRAFLKGVIKCGYRFAWERYLPERASEAEARESLSRSLAQEMVRWREAVPGCQKNLIVCFGYLSAPPESLNVNPAVDYKVWMDMQFNLLANDPAFEGVYGVMEYTSGYADEENVRWTSKLYRHYCIEGKREMLSSDPYMLTHIANPDFERTADGWTLSPAEEASIKVKFFGGLSWLQGRYPRTDRGDWFLWMKRSSRGPNRVSQEVANLQPGRLYSLKMFTTDYQDLIEGRSERQKHAISITLDGVGATPERSFQHIFPNCYDHRVGPFDDAHKAWMNYHWRVFRARGRTAKLTITDWASDGEPGGPIGQEIALNFVEVQPYLEE
jgi:hypothetical protein